MDYVEIFQYFLFVTLILISVFGAVFIIRNRNWNRKAGFKYLAKLLNIKFIEDGKDYRLSGKYRSAEVVITARLIDNPVNFKGSKMQLIVVFVNGKKIIEEVSLWPRRLKGNIDNYIEMGKIGFAKSMRKQMITSLSVIIIIGFVVVLFFFMMLVEQDLIHW